MTVNKFKIDILEKKIKQKDELIESWKEVANRNKKDADLAHDKIKEYEHENQLLIETNAENFIKIKELKDRLNHEVEMINVAVKDQIKELTRKLEEAEAVIRFYGNQFNWATYKEDSLCRLDLTIKDDSDSYGELNDEHENVLVCVGGKRARQFLA